MSQASQSDTSNTEIEGRFYARQSSASEEAVLIKRAGQFQVLDKDGGVLSQGEIETLRIRPKLGQLPQKVYLLTGDMFETTDFKALSKLQGKTVWSYISNAEKVGWHLIPLAIITPILAYGMYRLLIPLFISFAMFMTPSSIVATIDKNTMKTIDFTLMDDTELSEARQSEIKAIFDELTDIASERSDLSRRLPHYRLLFRSSEHIGPNAFALPGGTIVLTDELVEMFPKEDFVLAAVLAHEIGHVEYEHSLRQIYRALGMAAMVSLIAGDAGPMLEDIVLEGSALLSLSFSRKHELQSDDFSYELLKETSYSKEGLITFFERLDEEMPMPKKGEWLMTHPLSQKRIENMKAKIESESTNGDITSSDKMQSDEVIE